MTYELRYRVYRRSPAGTNIFLVAACSSKAIADLVMYHVLDNSYEGTSAYIEEEPFVI